MDLVYRDDKKEKWQSHEWHLTINERPNFDADIDIQIDGYGRDREQALSELKTSVIKTKERLQQIMEELDDVLEQNHSDVQET